MIISYLLRNYVFVFFNSIQFNSLYLSVNVMFHYHKTRIFEDMFSLFDLDTPVKRKCLVTSSFVLD